MRRSVQSTIVVFIVSYSFTAKDSQPRRLAAYAISGKKVRVRNRMSFAETGAIYAKNTFQKDRILVRDPDVFGWGFGGHRLWRCRN